MFFFFLTCPRMGKGGEIRTCDLHFIRHGSQPIKLLLGNKYYSNVDFHCHIIELYNNHIIV